MRVWRFDTAHGGPYRIRELGYSKVGGTWGIALRELTGNDSYPEDGTEESWLFNDAPRVHRIEAVEWLPQLLEKLIADADSATKKIKEKAQLAQELASAINKVVPEAAPQSKKLPQGAAR